MKKIFCLICGLVILCCSVSCASADPSLYDQEAEEQPTRIGISLLTTQLEYYISLFECYRSYAEEVGVELIICDAKWDRYKQSTDIHKLVNSGVDAIIISPTDPETICVDLIAAQEAGVCIIVEMTDVNNRFPLVSTDQYEGGRLAGEFAGNWINLHYDGSCDVAIVGYPFFDNTVQRQNGFLAGLNEVCPTANIVTIADGQAKSETSCQIMQEILNDEPNVRCVFGINDDTARGINKAFHATQIPSQDVCVIGFDADKSTQKLIDQENEYLKASVMADTQIIAKACIDNAIRLIQHQPVSNWTEVTDAQYMYVVKDSKTDY